MTVNELLEQGMTKEAANLKPFIQGALRSIKAGGREAARFAGNKKNWGTSNYDKYLNHLKQTLGSPKSTSLAPPGYNDLLEQFRGSAGKTLGLHTGALAGGVGTGVGIKELLEALQNNEASDIK